MSQDITAKSPPSKKARSLKSEVALYSYWRSSCSYRVRIVLGIKGIGYEYRAINLLENHHLGDEYRAHNPMKQLPTLLIDGHEIKQSVAIMEYLDETRPKPALLPSDAYGKAAVRNLVQIIVSDIQPLQNLRVLKERGLEHKMEWGHHWIKLGFEAFEAEIAKTAGKYCYGDEISLVDACLVPQVYNAKRFKVDMKSFPIIQRVMSNLEKNAAVQAAHPDKQPDATPDI